MMRIGKTQSTMNPSTEFVLGVVPVTWTLCPSRRAGRALSFSAVGIWEV